MNRHYTQIQQDTYEALMMDYAAGALDAALGAIMAAHVSLSPRGRDIFTTVECLGGTLIERYCEPVPLRAGALDAVLAQMDRIEQEAAACAAQKPPLPEDCHMPSCVMEFLTLRPGMHLEWRSMGPGLQVIALPLQSVRTNRAQVMKVDPGRAAPHARRRLLELTLVLDGAFTDETGQYEIGELLISTPEAKDRDTAACPEKGCVAFSVSSGPSHLPDPLVRLLASLFRS